MPNKYILVDASNVCYSKYHSVHARNAGSGLGFMETHAVHGFVDEMRSLINRFPSHELVLLYDGHPQFRHDIYPSYKAGRDKTPELVKKRNSVKKQMRIVKILCANLGIQSWFHKYAEADDLAAYFIRQNPDSEVILVSEDVDWRQLISPLVDVYTNNHLYTLRHFQNEYLLKSPQSIVEVKAIGGDSSDNIKGVGGLGKVRAISLVRATERSTFKNISNLLKWGLTKTDTEVAHVMGKPAVKFVRNHGESLIAGRSPHELFYQNTKLIDLNHNNGVNFSKTLIEKHPFSETATLAVLEAVSHSEALRRQDTWLTTFQLHHKNNNKK